MKKIFLSLFFLPLVSISVVFAAESTGVCGLVPPPPGQIYGEIKILKTKYKDTNVKAEAETGKIEKEKLQKEANEILKQVTMKEIEALSNRTAGWRVTEGLQVGNEGNLSLIQNQGGTWIPDKIIKLMAQIIGTFAILILAFGGLMMITSEGDENRLQNGKNIFFYTIVGLLVAFISYIGVQFIISVLFTTGGA